MASIAHLGEIGMGVGVVAHLVAFGELALDKLRIMSRVFANEEEGELICFFAARSRSRLVFIGRNRRWVVVKSSWRYRAIDVANGRR